MKNQVFLVFDSLRWDVFQKANAPFLKSLGRWRKAYTPGTYTLPAHMSFFVGRLPQNDDRCDYYDTVAFREDRKGGLVRHQSFWRLDNPESPNPAKYLLSGPNVIQGFRAKGYLTLGTAALNWFDPALPAGRYLTECFEEFRHFESFDKNDHGFAPEQIDWVLERIQNESRPYFIFINFGETHHYYYHKDCPWRYEGNPYGNAKACKERQRRSVEYLDGQVKRLFEKLRNFDAVLCADHGEAMGESGLWGHGFHHPKIAEVPFLIREF